MASADEASPAPSGTAGLPDPGRAYSSDALLEAMRTSRRPGGVPAELETDTVAAGLADLLWSVDGQRPSQVAVSGSCSGASCTIELVAVRDDADGEDVWRFAIEPSSGGVTLVNAELRAVPSDLVRTLDRIARREGGTALPEALVLASVGWRPPPESGVYDLAYRSGDEEGSCAVDVELDAAAGRIVELTSSDC